jgi:DNA-binding Lrp family transcriptional regulator
MKKVMDYICYRCIERELNGNVVAVSIPEIAENLNYSRNFTRNLVKKLKEKELITSVCESGFNEWFDKYVVVRGYKPTDKGKQTDSYEKALYELTEQ